MMQRRELLLLAHPYDPKKDRIAGRLVSEKLDGQRAWWDGGITRGVDIQDVPWANTYKDARLKDPDYQATGLWSRYARVIHAPDWFLNGLPTFPLDGELFTGRGDHQNLRSIVSRLVPDERWKQVDYHVFDWPTYGELFAPGRVVSGTIYEMVWGQEVTEFVSGKGDNPFQDVRGVFNRYNKVIHYARTTWTIHPQERLPMQTEAAEQRLSELMDDVLSKGGEGLILRSPHHTWEPKRTRSVLKLKPYHDDEATVLGYTWGKETDLGSRLLGLMGTLVVSWKGIEFELGSGFTDAEREMTKSSHEFAGKTVRQEIDNLQFPRGSIVTFKYRDLSDDGIPKEATYFRRRNDSE